MPLGNAMTYHPSGPRSSAVPLPYRYSLPSCAASVGEARRRALERLAHWALHEDTSDTAALVVSELVTNAVRHTPCETFTCELRVSEVHLRIEVEGGGRSRLLPRPRPAPDSEHGRGLVLVDALSTAWGVRDTGRGTHVVWADVPRSAHCRTAGWQ